MKITLIVLLIMVIFSPLPSPKAESNPSQEDYLLCLSSHSSPANSISNITYFPASPLFSSVLISYIRNAIFYSTATPQPLFIVAATDVSHIQASVMCCKTYGLEMRIRSGGHDYDGLSYVSSQPFIILDMFNMKSVNVSIEEESAWVESGATLGELYHAIAMKSNVHAFPAGVCPTVGVGGHLSGGGYGNLMRRFGLSVDNVVDAIIVDADGNELNRETMGEDMFWAINGGGGASFCVVVSWKIKLLRVPHVVTVFRQEKTLEENASAIVHQWQLAANQIDRDLFIRVVMSPSVTKASRTIRAKFNAMFLGDADRLMAVIGDKLPLLGLTKEDCKEMTWINSVIFWANYPDGTAMDVLLNRHPEAEKRQKKKSDYVREAIPQSFMEEMWKKMIDLKGPTLTLNPYGGAMDEIGESEKPFPHRRGNLYKIQYSMMWKDEGDDVMKEKLRVMREMHEFMTPYVSKAPRGAYLNYRDVDLGVNGVGNASYEVASTWGECYFKGNFERLVTVKTKVDPGNFFRYEQSVPSMPDKNASNGLLKPVHSGSSSLKFISWG